MRGRQLIILCTVVAAGCSSTPSRHWSPYAPPRVEDWHSAAMLVARHDANNDGSVTRRELEAGLRQDFRQADTNHDGRLDPEEVRAANQRRIGIDQSTAIPLIDWNEDGYVDFGEFANGVRSQFDQLDTNGDGEVSILEFRAVGVRMAPAPLSVPPPSTAPEAPTRPPRLTATEAAPYTGPLSRNGP
jgi:EF-hand domain pair